jgi:hypothetical protein
LVNLACSIAVRFIWAHLDDMTEWQEGLRYRVLYGFACRFIDGVTYSTFTREGTRSVPSDAILAEVTRVANVDRDDPNAMESAREAVEDARAGRHPRW